MIESLNNVIDEIDRGLSEKCKLPGLPDERFFDESVKELICRDAWDLKVTVEEDKSGWYPPTYRIDINPKLTPDTEPACQDARVRDKYGFVDNSIAECTTESGKYMDFCRCSLKEGSGYTEEFLAKEEPGVLYRGMSWEEMQFIKEHGFIKSNCAYNISECQIGLTFFSTDPEQAANYAGWFQPYPWQPTFERPAYVVKIKRPPDDRIDTESAPAPETGVRGEIPVSDILSVYEVRPFTMSPGFLELRPEWYKDGKVLVSGSRISPGGSAAFREMDVKEMFHP